MLLSSGIIVRGLISLIFWEFELRVRGEMESNAPGKVREPGPQRGRPPEGFLSSATPVVHDPTLTQDTVCVHFLCVYHSRTHLFNYSTNIYLVPTTCQTMLGVLRTHIFHSTIFSPLGHTLK